MGGVPCFRGTTVPFRNLTDYLAGGESLEEFLRQFPTVSAELAVQALAEAKGRGRRISDEIREIWADLPQESRDAMPADGSVQVDHYVYGLPKR